MKVAYLNGRWVPVEEARIRADDQGFLYGLGVFETVRVAGGRPVFLDRHLERLRNSVPVLGIDPPWTLAEVAAAVREVPSRNGVGDGAIRVTVTAGPAAGGTGAGSWEEGSGPALLVTIRCGRPYPERLYEQGVAAVTASGRRNHLSALCRVKSLNHAESILARREAAARGVLEALFLNVAGELAEGSATNLFVAAGGRLLTPAVACGILPGIARAVVLDLARGRLGLDVEEGRYPPALFERAEEAFLTNALMGVMPLVAVDGRPVGDGRPGPVTLALRRAYEALVAGEGLAADRKSIMEASMADHGVLSMVDDGGVDELDVVS